MGDLSKDFSEWEFICKCGCKTNIVSKRFIWMLQYSRELAGILYTITSGCRCPGHNKSEGGSPESDHLVTDIWQCEGADIACTSSHLRMIIINASIEAGFKRIGVAKTFIHLGCALRNTHNVLWTY